MDGNQGRYPRWDRAEVDVECGRIDVDEGRGGADVPDACGACSERQGRGGDDVARSEPRRSGGAVKRRRAVAEGDGVAGADFGGQPFLELVHVRTLGKPVALQDLDHRGDVV